MKNTLRKAALFLFFFLTLAPQMSLAVTPPGNPVGQTQGKSYYSPVAELGQQIQALVTGDNKAEIEPQETFGTRALGVILAFLNVVRDESENFATNVAALPQVTEWFNQQMTDPVLHDRWILIFQRLLFVVSGAFLAGWLADLFLLPARRRIRQQTPASLSARFGALLSWLFVSLMPLVVFLGAALALMDQSEQIKTVRYVVMTVVYALALWRLIRLVIRFLLAPRAENLRFLPISTPQAVYLTRWLQAFAAVMVTGFFVVDGAQLVRVPAAAVTAFSSLIGLIVVAMAIVIIVQKRAFVSTFLRGNLSAAQRGLTLWQGLRLWLARSWHVLAIAYLVIGYAVTILGAGGGFAVMQRGTILTLLVLFAMSMAFHVAARIKSKQAHKGGVVTSSIYRPVLQAVLRLATWVLGAAGIAAVWGVDVQAMFLSPWGQRIMGSLFTITTTIVIVVLIYEMVHAAIERKLNIKDAEGNVIEADARARTLLPMLRNAAMIVLGIVVGLVVLSELGVNIAPLLAGAGVIGVAIGFGSQALVKDFLTGLFIILEDTIAVGDVVKIGEHSGVVDGITIRTVRLRDLNGALHVLPFGEITKLVNMTKGFSYAVMDLSVAYDSDLRRVMEVMKETGDKLNADPEMKGKILEPIEIMGVETLGDSSITLRCRIKTKAGEQWNVRRAYMLRSKERFDAESIVIPFPTVMHVTRPDVAT